MYKQIKTLLTTGIKSITQNGDMLSFEGLLAAYSVDNIKDKIYPGAFQKTLNDATSRKVAKNKSYLFPLLYQHDMRRPIGGILEAKETNDGLWIKAEVDTSIPDGMLVMKGLTKQWLDGLSIGFYEVKSVMEQGINAIKEIALIEGSIVTLPCNKDALISFDSIKSEQEYIVKQMGYKTMPDLNSMIAAMNTVQLEPSSAQSILMCLSNMHDALSMIEYYLFQPSMDTGMSDMTMYQLPEIEKEKQELKVEPSQEDTQNDELLQKFIEEMEEMNTLLKV